MMMFIIISVLSLVLLLSSCIIESQSFVLEKSKNILIAIRPSQSRWKTVVVDRQQGNPLNWNQQQQQALSASPHHHHNRNSPTDTSAATLSRLISAPMIVTAVVSAILVMWSETAVVQTGCGPPQLPDAVERGSYLLVLAVSSSSLFLTIVTGGGGLANFVSPCKDFGLKPGVQLAEVLSWFAVGGAFLALGSQTLRGEQMDGLSGINIEMCRATLTAL